MKRTLPLIITFFVGMLIIISEFIPHPPFNTIRTSLEDWFMIIAGFSIILGQISLLTMTFLKIKHKKDNWQYYIVTIVSFFFMVIMGLLWGTEKQGGILGDGVNVVSLLGSKPFDYLFNNVYQHLQATMFSLLAFFIASAAYRAFIARSPESTLLLVAAILVMLGRTSVGSSLTGWLPESLRFLHLPNIADYIMKYPATAGQRAVMVSAALGVIGSSVRILLGIERSHLGGK